jgi:hypothetical protein
MALIDYRAWGFRMRNLLFLAGITLLLSGCLAERDRPGLKIKYAALDAAQGLVTPEVIKDCSDRIAKEMPEVTVVGTFALSANAAARVGDLQAFPSGPNDNIVALVALSKHKNVFGQEINHRVGCSYRLLDNKLVFRAVHGPGAFEGTLYIVH